MNTKLNSLVAERVMGYTMQQVWETAKPWSPSTDLNDALAALEKACPRSLGWDASYAPVQGRKYWCKITNENTQWAETLPLAMCICALRASGVSESDIKSAMEE